MTRGPAAARRAIFIGGGGVAFLVVGGGGVSNQFSGLEKPRILEEVFRFFG